MVKKVIQSTYITEFKEREFKQATDEFWKATKKSVLANMESIVGEIKNTFSELFSTIAKIQKNNDIGKITVSLIRISAWEKRQRAIIEVYDKDEIIGKLLYQTQIDISYIFTEWENYRINLITLAEKKGVRRYVKDAVIRFFMEEKLTDMASYLYAIFKYILIDAEELENYKLMNTIPGFMITIGEYMDWQNVLYVEVPEVDLNNINNESSVMFARFNGESYKELYIKDINMKHAKFTNCKFNKCTFENINLNDSLFTNCQFKDVVMKSGTMYGAIMKNCIRINSDFSGMATKWKPFQDSDKEYDIYQDAIGIDTDKDISREVRQEE